MANDSAIKSLCDAAVYGDVKVLRELLESDPCILSRPVPTTTLSVSSPTSTTSTSTFAALPLHIACRFGQHDFAKTILDSQPDLTEMVDPYDQSSTPLHIACRKNHLEIVQLLVSINPRVCFYRDSQGWNPVHVAAANGDPEILEVLINCCPAAAWEKTVNGLSPGGQLAAGDTVLHLCIKNRNRDEHGKHLSLRRKEALRKLVDIIDEEFMYNVKDGNERTILDVAVSCGYWEIVKFLLLNDRVKGFLDWDESMPLTDIFFKAISSKKVNKKNNKDSCDWVKCAANISRDRVRSKEVNNRNNALLVVASLIATVALTAGINPPGGVWQDNKDSYAGMSVMALQRQRSFKIFMIFNSLSLLFSITGILTLITTSSNKRAEAWYVTCSMVAAMVSIAVSYFTSIFTLSTIRHNSERKSPKDYDHTLLRDLKITGLGFVVFWVAGFASTVLKRKIFHKMTVWHFRKTDSKSEQSQA